MESSLVLLNRLEWLIRNDCRLKASRNAVALVTLSDNSSKFENIDLSIKKNNLEIQIVKEFILNPKMAGLVKVSVRDSLLDIRILDFRFRTKSYLPDKLFEDFLGGCNLFMFLFSDYNEVYLPSSEFILHKLRSKFRSKFGQDFNGFVRQLK